MWKPSLVPRTPPNERSTMCLKKGCNSRRPTRPLSRPKTRCPRDRRIMYQQEAQSVALDSGFALHGANHHLGDWQSRMASPVAPLGENPQKVASSPRLHGRVGSVCGLLLSLAASSLPEVRWRDVYGRGSQQFLASPLLCAGSSNECQVSECGLAISSGNLCGFGA